MALDILSALQVTVETVKKYVDNLVIKKADVAQDTSNAGKVWTVADDGGLTFSDGSVNGVQYVPQTLNEEQKLQARNNIGVGETIADTLISLELAKPLIEDDNDILADVDGVVLVYDKDNELFIKTVNGIEPDENGNVEIQVGSGSGVISWNDLEDKPFGESGGHFVVEWDGDTEGRDCFEDSSGIGLYKVSDMTPSYSDMQNVCFSISSAQDILSDGITEYDGALMINGGVLIITKTSVNIQGVDYVFPSPGVYFTKEFVNTSGIRMDAHIRKLKYGNMDIYWDGNVEDTNDKLYIENNEGNGYFCKVSDLTPTVEELSGVSIEMFANISGLPEYAILNLDDVVVFYQFVAIVYNKEVYVEDTVLSFPSTGIYMYKTQDFCTELFSYDSVEIYKLDEKYIPDAIARKNDIKSLENDIENLENDIYSLDPDTIARKSDIENIEISWNDLSDRPFYEEIIPRIELYNGVIGTDVVSSADGGWRTGHASEHGAAFNNFIPDATYIVYCNGKEYICTDITSQVVFEKTNAYYLGNPSLYRIYTDDTWKLTTNTNTGEPFILEIAEDGIVYFSSESTSGVRFEIYRDALNIIHKLDEHFIPDTIARASDISDTIVIHSTAQVGQTLIVKAIDENGKPTEWECVDMPSWIPEITEADEGAVLRVVNGVPTWVQATDAQDATF